MLEESGRAALHRRLDSLTSRLRRWNADALAELYFAANQARPPGRPRLAEAAPRRRPASVKPRADRPRPARPAQGRGRRRERRSARSAPCSTSCVDLRDETGAAVGYVHHTGHQGAHQRGTVRPRGATGSRRLALVEGRGATSHDARPSTARLSPGTVEFVLDFELEHTGSLRLRALSDTTEAKVEVPARASRGLGERDVQGTRRQAGGGSRGARTRRERLPLVPNPVTRVPPLPTYPRRVVPPTP